MEVCLYNVTRLPQFYRDNIAIKTTAEAAIEEIDCGQAHSEHSKSIARQNLTT